MNPYTYIEDHLVEKLATQHFTECLSRLLSGQAGFGVLEDSV